jgi:hypothetical protein
MEPSKIKAKIAIRDTTGLVLHFLLLMGAGCITLIQGKKGKYAAMVDDSLFLCLNFHRYLKEKKFLIQRKK